MSGAVVDRVGSRTATVATSIGLSAVLPFVALSPNAPALFVSLIVLGALDGMTDVAMNAQAVQLQRERAGSIMTRMHAMWSMGAVTGGLIASRAATAGIELRTQLIVTAAVLCALTILAARWLLPLSSPEPVDGVTEVDRRASRSLLVRLFAVGVAVALTELPSNDWAALMLTDRFGLTSGRAALGFVAFAGGMLAGRLAGDLVVDRWGLEHARRGGAVVALAGLVIATTFPTALAAGAGLLVAGAGASTMFPVMFRTAGELTASSSGMAAFSSGARLGILVAAPLVGVLAEATSVAAALLMVSGASAILVAAASLPQAAERQIAATPPSPATM
jgi:predicted MFS family arabinose efflux permease